MIAAIVAGVAISVAPGPLAKALSEWGAQVKVQMLFRYDELKGLGTLGFKCADCDPYEALTRIIDGQATWHIVRNGEAMTVTVLPVWEEGNL